VLCSEKEGIPRSIMEAMALEKPVVATDVMGTQEVVVNNETGFLIPLGNTDKFLDKIIELANDPELRIKMGQAGKKRVIENFNDVKIAQFLKNFYISSCRK
jgi:glycosyltransferase involved in cell wall biosynthesis